MNTLIPLHAFSDPHGIILSVVSISVVFAALIVLYIAYTVIGRIVSGRLGGSPAKPEAADTDAVTDDEAAAAVIAIHQHLNETVHDMESYVITIKPKR